MTTEIILAIRQALQQKAAQGVPKSNSRFFKKGEATNVYGLKNEDTLLVAKKWLPQIKRMEKQYVFIICDALWKSTYLEEALIACKFSITIKQKFELEDFDIFESWVQDNVKTWADCDTFCNHTIGTFVMMYPEYLHRLKDWANTDNRWLKRAAAVSLIYPAKKGMFLSDIFEIADILLLDKDDLVQKGYGWMLKVASQVNLNEVFGYVMTKKAVMPRTALRYAIEKMPFDMKKQAMAK